MVREAKAVVIERLRVKRSLTCSSSYKLEHVFRHVLDTISFRINRNKKWRYLFCFWTEFIHHAGQVRECRRTDIRAIRESEECQKPFSTVCLFRYRLSKMIGQRKARTERGIRLRFFVLVMGELMSGDDEQGNANIICTLLPTTCGNKPSRFAPSCSVRKCSSRIASATWSSSPIPS